MTTTREQVFNALLDLMASGVPGIQGFLIKNYSRRMIMPANIPVDDTPSLFVWEQDELTVDKGTATPSIRYWDAWVVLVMRNPDKQRPGGTIINPIIEQVEAAIPDPSTDIQTLDGLVTWTKIMGDTIKNTGDTDPNGLGGFVIPVKMLVP